MQTPRFGCIELTGLGPPQRPEKYPATRQDPFRFYFGTTSPKKKRAEEYTYFEVHTWYISSHTTQHCTVSSCSRSRRVVACYTDLTWLESTRFESTRLDLNRIDLNRLWLDPILPAEILLLSHRVGFSPLYGGQLSSTTVVDNVRRISFTRARAVSARSFFFCVQRFAAK